MNSPVSIVESSENAKTGKVSATYAAQTTCPKSCPLMGSGCYAETGTMGFNTHRLNRNARAGKQSKLVMAKLEAKGIRGLTGRNPLRLHVVGDATTDECASVLADAAAEYMARFGSKVWTYTHAWRKVKRVSWGKVSVLASCETIGDAKVAMARGYGAAVVMDSHDGYVARMVDGVKVIPCPQQTGRAGTCLECKLCWKDGTLRGQGAVVAFEAHGSGQGKVREQLVQIGGVA